MACCGVTASYVPDMFLARCRNFLESPLVAWQPHSRFNTLVFGFILTQYDALISECVVRQILLPLNRIRLAVSPCFQSLC